MNAQTTYSFAGLSESDVTLGDASAWSWGTKSNKPSLSLTGAQGTYTITIKGVTFIVTRGASSDFYRLYDEGLYTNGTKVLMDLSGLTEGQTITVNAAAKGNTAEMAIEATKGATADESNVNSTAADDFKDFKFIVTKSDVQLRNVTNGMILKSITITDAPAQERTFTGTVVSQKTVWTISGYEDGVEISNGVSEQNGLYFRGNTGSHAVKADADTLTAHVQGVDYDVTNIIQLVSNTALNPGLADAAADVVNANDRAIAFNAGVPGHVVVLMKPASMTSGRFVQVFIDGEKAYEKEATAWKSQTRTVDVDGVPTEKTGAVYDAVDVEIAGKASVFVGGTVPTRIAAIGFFPTSDYNAQAETVDGIEEVVSSVAKSTNGKIFNLAGQLVNENYKGVVIKNGKKFIQK